MGNLLWTPHFSIAMDNSLNHSSLSLLALVWAVWSIETKNQEPLLFIVALEVIIRRFGLVLD